MDFLCQCSTFHSKAAPARTICPVIQSVENGLRFEWVTVLSSEVFLECRLRCLHRWVYCFRAHPTCVFMWEWGTCVECSYFGWVAHNENCSAVTQVYCCQQVPPLANARNVSTSYSNLKLNRTLPLLTEDPTQYVARSGFICSIVDVSLVSF